MTAKDFGRLAEIMVKKPKWTLADRDAVVVALREAEKRLLGAGQVMRGSHVYNSHRKEYPLATGLLDYFPQALLEVAHVSYKATEQHHPGEPLHWDRNKSTDEPDALLRHFIARGTRDTDGLRHSAKVAWRALALLQKEIEAERVAVSGRNAETEAPAVVTPKVHPDYLKQCGGWLDIGPYCGTCDRCVKEGEPYAKPNGNGHEPVMTVTDGHGFGYVRAAEHKMHR